MLGSGCGLSAQEIIDKEAQEKELKAAQDRVAAQGVSHIGKTPSRTPSNLESSDDSSSDSISNSDSSDEDIKDGDDDAAKKRRKAKKKKAKKILKKMIKEQARILRPATTKCPSTTRNFRATTTTHNFLVTILTTNSILYIWESLPTLMGRTIPNGLMICKCTFTSFTLLFGKLCV
jgi:hypothetical protein